MKDKGRELRTTNETERIRVHHILVGQHRIILHSDVIRQYVIENEMGIRWEKEEGIVEEVTERLHWMKMSAQTDSTYCRHVGA